MTMFNESYFTKKQLCTICKRPISPKAYEYSMKHYGQGICYSCQNSPEAAADSGQLSDGLETTTAIDLFQNPFDRSYGVAPAIQNIESSKPEAYILPDGKYFRLGVDIIEIQSGKIVAENASGIYIGENETIAIESPDSRQGKWLLGLLASKIAKEFLSIPDSHDDSKIR